MPGRRRALLLLLVAAAGCSSEEPPALPLACTEGEEAVAAALQAAPREVALPDGTKLSACVRNARSESELQSVGLVLTGVAEDLEAGAASAPRSALQLGYLIGAARRGAPSESSLQAELVYRLERSAALDLSAESQRALEEGLRAGEARG
jgi:hypothetical protein